jgi:hypothetical protein
MFTILESILTNGMQEEEKEKKKTLLLEEGIPRS